MMSDNTELRTTINKLAERLRERRSENKQLQKGNSSLRKQVARLQAENEGLRINEMSLKEQVARLQAENDERSDNTKLRSANEKSVTEIKQLRMKDSLLREQVVRLQAENDDLKSLVDMSKITSDTQNADILNRIKNNDASLNKLWLCDFSARDEAIDYCPEGSRDMEMLGYYISKNTELRKLCLTTYEDQEYLLNRADLMEPVFNRADLMEPFFKVLRNNNSIQTLRLYNSDLSDRGSMFDCMAKFFQSSNSLTNLELEECNMGAESCRALSQALKGCTSSLREFKLQYCGPISDEYTAEIFEALGVHHLLELIAFKCNQMEVKGCYALATLLVNVTNLHTLDLSWNNINDEGLEALVHALADGSKVRVLELSGNSITAKGHGALSKLLCDTSSVNQTFLSNHTLHEIFDSRTQERDRAQAPPDLIRNLQLNNLDDKKEVAMTKVLRHHKDFDMRPLFEWDFRALPYVMEWLEAANDCPTDFEKNIGQRKLSVAYQFVRGMPASYIDRCVWQ